MMLAARIGLTRSEWGDMTPRELSIWAKAYAAREKAERRKTETRIYNLAALTRGMIWGKHPPRFETVFPEKGPNKKAMNDEEMFAQVQALNALFGGREE